MTRMTFGFFRNPIQQVVKSSASHLATMALGASCGLGLFKLQDREEKASSSSTVFFPDTAITPDLLLHLVTHDSHRYPYIDEQKRSEIFDHLLEQTAENYGRSMMEVFLHHALESNQFTAINAVIRQADYLVSSQLLQTIAQNLPILSYQMIVLRAENKLAAPFEEAFFSSKSGIEVPRVFFDHPCLAEEVAIYIKKTKNSNESNIRSIFFHDGNMTYNQTIVTASLRGEQLAFHPGNSCEQNIFYESLLATLFNLDSAVKPY